MGQGAANAASILEKAAVGYIQGVTTRDQVQAQRAKDRNSKAKEDYISQTGAMQQQIDLLSQQNVDSQRKFDKTETFSSLRMFQSDGNPRHINKLLKNQRIAEALGVTEIGLLDPYSPADIKIIAESGGNPEDFKPIGIIDNSDEAELLRNRRQRYVKSRLPNGEWKVTDMQNVYEGTGFAAAMNDEELTALMKKSRVKAASGGGTETLMVRNARASAGALDRTAGNEPGTSFDSELTAFANKEKAGVRPGQVDVAEDTGAVLVDSFGGEDTFYETDFSDRKNFNKAWPAVQKMMHVTGDKFSAKDRTAIHDIRAMLALGEPGAELTSAETGIMDNLLSNISKYLTDNVGGIAAKSAYAAFRNSTRHALYGAALTEAEITSFNEAFGTLGQKLGPVLAQFKTSLVQVKAKLDSIASLNDPRVSKVMLGADQERMDRMIVAIDERLEYITGMTDKNPSRVSLSDRIKAKRETAQ